MIRWITLLVYIFSFSSLVSENNEAFHIKLGVKNQKKALYIGFSSTTNPQISQALDILTKDVSQSSHMHAYHSWPKAESYFSQMQMGPTNYWQGDQVDFVLRIDSLNENLRARLLDVREGDAYDIEIPLNLDEGISFKRALHLLHDEVHYYITGQEGIASSKLIFCLRNRIDPDDSESWISEIYEVGLDGSELKQKTFDKNYCVTPALLPSSHRRQILPFYYVSYKSGLAKIQHWDKYGTRPLIMLRGNQWMPITTISSGKIAFVSDISGKPDLFVQNVSQQFRPLGKPRQLFSPKAGVVASPTLNPDGTMVAFVSNHEGRPTLYTLPINKNQSKPVPQRLISTLSEAVSPRWSPDGNKLAFSMKIEGWRQVMVYDFEAQELVQLTEGEYNCENPAWAANSEHLVYNKAKFEESDLCFIHIVEGKEYSIPIPSKGDCFFPILEQWDLRKKLN